MDSWTCTAPGKTKQCCYLELQQEEIPTSSLLGTSQPGQPFSGPKLTLKSGDRRLWWHAWTFVWPMEALDDISLYILGRQNLAMLSLLLNQIGSGTPGMLGLVPIRLD